MFLFSARLRRFLRLCLPTILIFLGCWVPLAHALDTVTLQLKWSHAFQFAGYYAAKEKGYYRDAGLDVVIQEASPGDDPLKIVLGGKAQYGVGNSSLLLVRNSGQPVVVLATIFQHSPVVFLARQQGPVQAIHDLAGKRLMIEPQSDELLAYLKHEGIPLASISQIEHSFKPQDLIDGKVDAISAYVTNEPYYLDRAGIAYHTYSPRSVGIDFYGDNLFTTEQELRSNPARVEALRAASLRGWEYAMAHPEEIADLIVAKYSQRHEREFYLFEAKRMAALLRTDLIEVGYMNPGRWRHIAETYADLGLLPKDFSLDGFIYNVKAELDLTWIYIAGLLLAIVSGVTVHIHRINRHLNQALIASKKDHELLRVSEERHRLLADNATDVIWMMNLDGRFTYVSPSVEKLRGYTSDEVMQQTLAQALTATSIPIAEKALSESIAAMKTGKAFIEFRGELEQPCKDGSTVWTEVTTSGMKNEAGGFIGILGVTRNITERKHAESELRQSEQRFRSIFESAADPILLISMDGHVRDANPEACRAYGYARVEFIGKHSSEFVRTDQIKVFADAVAAIKAGQKFSAESVDLRKDGTSFSIEVHIAPLTQQSELVMLCFIRDITERKQLEEQVRQLAFFDPLTKLPNRRLLTDRLNQTIAASKRSGCHSALMFLDLDNFKPLNDTHGHDVGDTLLIEAADRLKACIRETDTVSRLGGDEFVVLINELTADRAESASEALFIAEKIRTNLAEPYRLVPKRGADSDQTICHQCTASIGVTLFVNHGTSLADILKRADSAMYQAKRAGRNQIQLDDEDAILLQ